MDAVLLQEAILSWTNHHWAGPLSLSVQARLSQAEAQSSEPTQTLLESRHRLQAQTQLYTGSVL